MPSNILPFEINPLRDCRAQSVHTRKMARMMPVSFLR